MPEIPQCKYRPHPRTRPSLDGPGSPVRPAPATRYAELQVTSNYTFLTGASHPEEYFQQAAALGLEAVALTDLNTVAGIVRAHVAAKEAGVQFIVGSRVMFQLEADRPETATLLLYPTDIAAYGRLCTLLTLGKRRAPKGECRLMLHDLADLHDGLIAVMTPPKQLDHTCIETLEGLRGWFQDDRLSLAASCPYGEDDRDRLRQVASLAKHTGVPLVATNDVHYHDPARRPLQDVLTCIRHGCSIDRAGYRLFANAERCLKPADEMRRLFADHPDAIHRSVEIAQRTRNFSLDSLRYQYPDEACPPGVSPIEHLTRLTRAGVRERYPDGLPGKIRTQIDHELALIEELNYAPYFLTVHDLVVHARGRGILCQGRGAAANSAVCYCLGVTAVDPGRVNLLFERFISRERNEPPDIDIDFEHERREEVIQYIYRKYGRDRAALTAEVISYRGRSAVREVGKALGLSLDLVDQLAKNIDWWSDQVTRARGLRDAGLNPDDPTVQRLTHLAGEIMGFPRHLSQHVGGFVITRGPLSQLVPIENARMDDRTVIEWDKDDIDEMGMLKVDVLGLGMMTCVSKCLGLVNEQRKRLRDLETERRSDLQTVEREDFNGQREDISRSDRVAEKHGVGAGDLQRDPLHAVHRAVRADVPDASIGRFDSLEHRGRLWPSRPPRSVEVPAHRPGVPERTVDSIRACDQHGDDPRPVADHRLDPRNRPGDPRPDQQSHPQDLTHSVSQSLSLSVSPLQFHTIPPEDPAVYDMICRADTIGVFQIESRAQMQMLPRLKPRHYYDLVIEVAIVRPGPIQGDMVHPYLRRRRGDEAVSYPNDAVRAVLERTLGVPLFQEQAMALAIVAAGFTPGEADQLRRAIAAWKTKEKVIYSFGKRLIEGMINRGYPREFAERCFEQLKGFSEYGFPESHAASFALIVYVSAWLKCHHPAAFAAALINSQPMGFYAPAQIIRDAQQHGVEVRGIDVNESGWDCGLEERDQETERQRDGVGANQPPLRLGMRLIKGLREEHARAIAEAVHRHGRFRSVEALWKSARVPVAAMKRLARADAFQSMGLDRQAALWQVRMLRDEPLPLFDEALSAANPAAEPSPLETFLPPIPPLKKVIHDYGAAGLSLKAHPLSFIRHLLDRRKVTANGELADQSRWPHGSQVSVAGMALVRQRPATASGVVFITLEDETGVANLVVRPAVFERYRKAARHGIVLLARGRVERDGDVIHILTRSIECLDHHFAELSKNSRDFH